MNSATPPFWPYTAAEITPAWLSAVLEARYPGVDVATVEVAYRAEVTNSHARIRMTYHSAAGAPETMFCKLPPTDERRQAILATRMGQREAQFYARLASSIEMRIPVAHAALTDDDQNFVILLEDLSVTDCKISDGTWGIDADAAAGVIDDLAALHARFEDPARRKAEAPWVIKHRVNRDYGPGLLRYGLTNHRDRLSDEFATIAELYISHPDEMQELWRQGPTTIIHGDTHIGNLFIEGNRVGFLDWGIINVNSALRELGYFLTMSMDIDARRGAEVDLIRHYLDRRRANGAAEVSFDEAWRCYRQQAAYNVLASAQVVTFPENATPARKVFANAFLARAEASIADLDTVSALRDVGLG